jgi:hypothetical protein
MLLLEALQLQGSGPGASIPGLCHLTAALLVSSHQLLQLLQITIKNQQSDNLEILWQFPALRQLGQAELAQLLLAAADTENVGVIRSIRASWSRWSTDARQLSSAAVLPALEAAVKRNTWCLQELLQLPAAKQISGEELAQLIQTAVLCDKSSRLDALCKLPAAQQLSSAAVEQLLLAALQHVKAAAVPLLCRLPAAQQLGEKMRQLRQLAEQLKCDECVQMLRSLTMQQ